MDNPSMTIHALSSAARYQTAAICRGRAINIVQAGCGPTGWQTPGARGSSQECVLKNAYMYFPAPPQVPVATALASDLNSTIEEWDTRPSESEKFSTAELALFESTLSCSLLPSHSPPSGEPQTTAPNVNEDHNRTWPDVSSPSRPPAKRIKLDMGPLGELIPAPHYVPAPLKSSPPSLPLVPLDGRLPLLPVPPQTASSVEALLSSTYSRVAWLIPVRGSPPWEGVSGASVALDGQPSASGGDYRFWTSLRSCSEAPDS
ncbi:hypothetical protein F5148DRAFT_1155943, partial [Russula earlei]